MSSCIPFPHLKSGNISRKLLTNKMKSCDKNSARLQGDSLGKENSLEEGKRAEDIEPDFIVTTPFENILGYNGYVMKKVYGYDSEYYFYDENDALLFMTFGGEYFVRDLNGDGENELISNQVWSDGGRATYVFVKKDNEIYMGYLDDLLDEPYDLLDEPCANSHYYTTDNVHYTNVHYVSEYSRYLPEENVVEIFYWIEADQDYRSKKYDIDLDKLTYRKASEEIGQLGFDEEIAEALEAAGEKAE